MEKFKLPIKLQEDKEYSSYLVYILNQYIIYAEKLGVEIEVLENVKENVKLIIDCIEYYYSGQVSEAKKNIAKILYKYKHNQFIISKLDESYCFRGTSGFKDSLNQDSDKDDITSKYDIGFLKLELE